MLRRTFRTTENLDRYGTVEDRPVGWAVQGTAGPNLRFREDSTRAFAAQGFLGAAAFPLRTVGVSLEAAGSLFLRHDRSAGERTIRAVGTITWQPNRRWLSLLQSAILTGADRPATSVVYIGTGNGLRGFPARAFEARSYVLVTFEQRFWTGIEVLWTGIGMNLFLDGALPSDGRLQDGEHWRSGCGAGLLLGFKKSLQKPIRIEVAWRTDRRADPTLSISMRTPLRIIPAILFPSPTARFAEIAR